MRRLFWKSFGGEAELVYFHVSDRVVFRIHVDTGIDSAASAYKTASADTKQTGAYGHGSYDSGDCIIYTAAGYSGREDAWNDCDASCLFSVFGHRCDCVSSVGHTGKSILYQKESGSDLRKEEPEYEKNIGYVNLDSSIALWLMEHLPPGELKNGIEDLLNKECSSLILESDTDELSVWDHSVIRCGTLEIYPKSRKVEQNGTEISLTPKEFDILLFLARNRGEVFTKEQIYQAVWDGEYLMDDSNIMAFIRKIRKKIEPNPDAPEYIVTIWGIGYKFSDRL